MSVETKPCERCGTPPGNDADGGFHRYGEDGVCRDCGLHARDCCGVGFIPAALERAALADEPGGLEG